MELVLSNLQTRRHSSSRRLLVLLPNHGMAHRLKTRAVRAFQCREPRPQNRVAASAQLRLRHQPEGCTNLTAWVVAAGLDAQEGGGVGGPGHAVRAPGKADRVALGLTRAQGSLCNRRNKSTNT